MLGLTRARFIVYAESPDPAQNRSLLKRAVQRAFGRWVAKRASGFLTVSHLACRYYRGLGFRTDQMYPFGYFRAQPSPLRSGRLNPDQTMEVLFIGQIIHRKGLDVLVKAMTPLFAEYGNLYLRVIGTGESINLLQDEVRSLGLQERVIFEGVMASDRIYSRLASVDVLVLPSRWDGWGMVINEAFAVGVPVIASDRCGAAELIHEGENGYVFRSEDVEDLHRCLHAFLRSRDDWPRFRAQAAATGNRISTAAVAPYLVACLENIAARSSRKPSPPWG
jgi:glycosyltransferase involved in cell wall biosynthesis